MSDDSVAVQRSRAMGERVLRTAVNAGTPEGDLDLLRATYERAMEPRIRLLESGEVPDFLHPGRSALILLLDTQESHAVTLAAAMLIDSERPELRPELDGLDGEVVRLAGAVPLPEQADLVERLVLADDNVQRIALAERLDHLRHAHLWSDPARRAVAHEGAVSIYAPVAHRVNERLARRFDHWCGAFAERHLPRGG